jgi:hypothetical protein
LRSIGRTVLADRLGDDVRQRRDQLRQAATRLTAPKTFLPFTDAEGAGEHCQSGAVALADARIFDWLDVTLG